MMNTTVVQKRRLWPWIVGAVLIAMLPLALGTAWLVSENADLDVALNVVAIELADAQAELAVVQDDLAVVEAVSEDLTASITRFVSVSFTFEGFPTDDADCIATTLVETNGASEVLDSLTDAAMIPDDAFDTLEAQDIGLMMATAFAACGLNMNDSPG
jgi:hypothetical protein